MDMPKNLPNILTTVRLFLAPLFVYFYFASPAYSSVMAVMVLVLSGLTDVLDGFIARRFGLTSQLGQFLDPLADKVTILCVIVSLAVRNMPVRILLIIYLLKELTLGFIGLVMLRSWRNSPPARWYGKAATVFLYTFFFVMLFFPGIPEVWEYPMMAVPVVFMVLSFIFYLKEIKKRRDRL